MLSSLAKQIWQEARISQARLSLLAAHCLKHAETPGPSLEMNRIRILAEPNRYEGSALAAFQGIECPGLRKRRQP